jgi:hypothetical protein
MIPHLIATEAIRFIDSQFQSAVERRIMDAIKEGCGQYLDEFSHSIRIRTWIYFLLLAISQIPFFLKTSFTINKFIWFGIWIVLIYLSVNTLKKILEIASYLEDPHSRIKKLLDEGIEKKKKELGYLENFILMIKEDRTREKYVPWVYMIFIAEISARFRLHKNYFYFRLILYVLVVFTLSSSIPHLGF